MSRTALELIGQAGLGYSFDTMSDEATAHPYTGILKELPLVFLNCSSCPNSHIKDQSNGISLEDDSILCPTIHLKHRYTIPSAVDSGSFAVEKRTPNQRYVGLCLEFVKGDLRGEEEGTAGG